MHNSSGKQELRKKSKSILSAELLHHLIGTISRFYEDHHPRSLEGHRKLVHVKVIFLSIFIREIPPLFRRPRTIAFSPRTALHSLHKILFDRTREVSLPGLCNRVTHGMRYRSAFTIDAADFTEQNARRMINTRIRELRSLTRTRATYSLDSRERA